MKKSNAVKIYTAAGENSAKVIKSFLEDRGIESLIQIDSSGDAIFGNIGGNSSMSNWGVYVLGDKVEEAKELLKKIQGSGEHSKGSGDFSNFGTYQAQEADILRRELMKNGITVKKEYPGTGIGTDAAADASFSAYTLLIEENNFEEAKKIREKFNIEPIKKGEEMPLPKNYKWKFIAVAIVGYFALAIIGSLLGTLGLLNPKIEKILIITIITLAGITVLGIFYKSVKSLFKR